MADAQRRRHLEGSKVVHHPIVKKAFATVCALLIVYKAEDLEADIVVEGRQFHIEVSEVNKK